jgi:hypothetical protein
VRDASAYAAELLIATYTSMEDNQDISGKHHHYDYVSITRSFLAFTLAKHRL